MVSHDSDIGLTFVFSKEYIGFQELPPFAKHE